MVPGGQKMETRYHYHTRTFSYPWSWSITAQFLFGMLKLYENGSSQFFKERNVGNYEKNYLINFKDPQLFMKGVSFARDTTLHERICLFLLRDNSILKNATI